MTFSFEWHDVVEDRSKSKRTKKSALNKRRVSANKIQSSKKWNENSEVEENSENSDDDNFVIQRKLVLDNKNQFVVQNKRISAIPSREA